MIAAIDRWRRQQGRDLLQGCVDAVTTALLGNLVRSAFGREVGGEGFGIGHAGEVGAFDDVLVVGFRGKEKRRRFGVDDC